MAGTNYDVVINGVKARIASLPEGGGGYKRRSVRREIQNQIIAQAENPALRNRDDGVAVLQTSWAGGARWWKPLITPQDLSSYFQSNHMDTWSEPGKVVPSNKVSDAANTSIHNNCVVGTDGTTIYAIGDTTTTAATMRDVYVWTPASNAFVRATTYSAGIQDDSDPVSITYHDGYFYVLAKIAAGGWEIGRFNPSVPSSDLTWLGGSGTTPTRGASIFTTPYGVMFGIGIDIQIIDIAGVTNSSAFNPGWKEPYAGWDGSDIVGNAPLAVATTQGVYLVRNAPAGGVIQASVFRIDRDTSGTYIGNPIATLPVGLIALSAQFHLGQLIVIATPDREGLLKGSSNIETQAYFVGEGGSGTLGSFLGGRDELDETVFQFLGTLGTTMYVAGQKRLWVYDSTRGGLHTAFEFPTAVTAGGYTSMALAQNSSGESIIMFLGKDRLATVKDSKVADPDTVTAFGDDETHYVLESNFFDGGLPMELKEITEVALLREKDDGGSEWTIQIAADDGSFADALVSAGSTIHDKTALSGTTGYQFRYKLIYQTKDTARSALRSVLITMTTGDMLTEWDMILDGSELLNMDNERQDPKTFADSMVTLGANANIIALIDNYTDLERTVLTTATGTNVKVIAVEVVKDTPGESNVRVLLREA